MPNPVELLSFDEFADRLDLANFHNFVICKSIFRKLTEGSIFSLVLLWAEALAAAFYHVPEKASVRRFDFIELRFCDRRRDLLCLILKNRDLPQKCPRVFTFHPYGHVGTTQNVKLIDESGQCQLVQTNHFFLKSSGNTKSLRK